MFRPRFVMVPLFLAAACSSDPEASAPEAGGPSLAARVAQYTTVRLDPDLSSLSDSERRMIPLLLDAADAMDEIFWIEAYGSRDSLLASLADADARRYVEINYGPWDRLAGNEPFLPGAGPKPLGSNFYPHDITKAEFDSAAAGPAGDSLRSLYTLVRRDSGGSLSAIPYHVAFAPQVARAAGKLREAAALAESASLRRYLELRADALLDDDYQSSDLAWLDMKDNAIEVVIGPIETYEDALYGYKAAHEAFVLIKDREWSERLSRYAALLPSLQRGLPVPSRYRAETPGTDSDLNAYDAVYYAGDANAGSKTIAINLPNDEDVQLRKGTRRLQLKNSMRAKFDRILVPITDILMAEDQRASVNFDAFFENVMFHEVAHGLGVKNTVTGRGTVREALKEQAGAFEEGKADVLGLYMVTALSTQGELTDSNVEDNYITFIAGIFRSIRFGASSAHGRANLARFNFFQEMGAFTRDSASGTYRVDTPRMVEAMNALSEKILTLQGNGDYDGVVGFMDQYGKMTPQLESDLERLAAAEIPVDIVFEQGHQREQAGGR
ncbi:MAG TPA: hypothetical protein VK012_01610, partial [Gemmatimonadales bacterium]|nr:hypothetical protein [Gemmatimonadales bacterium]